MRARKPLHTSAALLCGAIFAGACGGDDQAARQESAKAWQELRRVEAKLRSEEGAASRRARKVRQARRARDRREVPRVVAVVRSVNSDFLAGRFDAACAHYSPAGRRDVAAWLRSGSCSGGLRRAWSLIRRVLDAEQWHAFLDAEPRVRVRGRRALARLTPPPGAPASIRLAMERSNEELVRRGRRWQIASFP